MAEQDVVKTTTFECGCVTHWKVEPLEPTPLTCPVHGKIWAHTESERRDPDDRRDNFSSIRSSAAGYEDREHDHACCPPDDCCGGPCAAHPCWYLTT